nr:hypothetical protein [Gulosibacter hominis]
MLVPLLAALSTEPGTGFDDHGRLRERGEHTGRVEEPLPRRLPTRSDLGHDEPRGFDPFEQIRVPGGIRPVDARREYRDRVPA